MKDLNKIVYQESDIDKLIVGPATEDFIKNYAQKYDVDEIKNETNQIKVKYPFLYKVSNDTIWFELVPCVVVFLLYTYLWNILVAIIYLFICGLGCEHVHDKLVEVLCPDQARALGKEYDEAYKNDKHSK